MARKRDSWTSMLSCSVCLEDYEVDGGHIPILLPCSHTLCESCVKQTVGVSRGYTDHHQGRGQP